LTPVGVEFLVNSTSQEEQIFPAIAMDDEGNSVVVWQSPDGSGYGIFAQMYDSSGTPVGTEFQVSETIDGDQTMPAVAMSNVTGSNGGFVVAWQTIEIADPYDIVYQVYTRRFSATGSPINEDRQMNSFDSVPATNPAVAMSPDGSFVVVWEGGASETTGGVLADVYTASTDGYAGEFLAPSATTRQAIQPTVAMNAEGDFVVAWHCDNFGDDLDKRDIIARLFKAPAEPTTTDFRVNNPILHAPVEYPSGDRPCRRGW